MSCLCSSLSSLLISLLAFWPLIISQDSSSLFSPLIYAFPFSLSQNESRGSSEERVTPERVFSSRSHTLKYNKTNEKYSCGQQCLFLNWDYFPVLKPPSSSTKWGGGGRIPTSILQDYHSSQFAQNSPTLCLYHWCNQ